MRAATRLVEQGELEPAVIDMNLAGESSAPPAGALAARRIPFLIVTGYGAGAPEATQGAPILAKPFETDELVRAVARVAGR